MGGSSAHAQVAHVVTLAAAEGEAFFGGGLVSSSPQADGSDNVFQFISAHPNMAQALDSHMPNSAWVEATAEEDEELSQSLSDLVLQTLDEWLNE